MLDILPDMFVEWREQANALIDFPTSVSAT
jgi:hypothetical protein